MTDVTDDLEPGRTSVDHGFTARIKRSDTWRSAFRHAQTRHTARTRAPVVQQRLPARVSGQDSEARLEPALLVPARVHRRGAVRHPARHGRLSDVRLHAVGRFRLRRHATPEDRRRLRPADQERASLVGAPDGARRRAAPRARLLRRRVQEAARVQLGDRRDAAAAHARLLVHRLPAARGTSSRTGRSRSARTSCTTSRSSAAGCRTC